MAWLRAGEKAVNGENVMSKSTTTTSGTEAAAAGVEKPRNESAADQGVTETDNAIEFESVIGAELGLSPEDLGEAVSDEETENTETANNSQDDSDKTETDGEEQSEHNAEEAEDDSDDELPPWMKKRLAKQAKDRDAEKARADTLERQLQQMQTRLQQLENGNKKQQADTDDGDDPMSGINTAEDIASARKKWENVEAYTWDNLDGVEGVKSPDGELHDYTAAEMRRANRNAKEMLKALDRREHDLAEQAKAQQIKRGYQANALKEFPEIYQDDSPEFKSLGLFGPSVLKAIDELPHGDLLLGIFAAGMKSTELGKKLLGNITGTPGERPAKVTPAADEADANLQDVVSKRLERAKDGATPGVAPKGASKGKAEATDAAKQQAALKRLEDSAGEVENLIDFLSQ